MLKKTKGDIQGLNKAENDLARKTDDELVIMKWLNLEHLWFDKQRT